MLKRGNIGLTRFLIALNNAGEDGISTVRLLKKLGSIHHGQTFIKRAEREGLIKRKRGEPPGPGQFAPMYNIITQRGKDLLQNNLLLKQVSENEGEEQRRGKGSA